MLTDLGSGQFGTVGYLHIRHGQRHIVILSMESGNQTFRHDRAYLRGRKVDNADNLLALQIVFAIQISNLSTGLFYPDFSPKSTFKI